MQSAYHNVPLINGVQQHEGAKYTARNPQFQSSGSAVNFSLDIAAAYPADAHVNQWQRTYRLQRATSFSITDTYSLTDNNGKNELHFMTNNKVEKIKEGVLRLTGENTSLDLKYNPGIVTPLIEPIEIKDSRLLQSWPKDIYRIIFTIKDNKKGQLHLGIYPIKIICSTLIARMMNLKNLIISCNLFLRKRFFSKIPL